MILRDVKQLLVAQRKMTLSQLAAETGEDKSTVISALEYFVRRGNVSREVESASGVSCGTMCTSCPISNTCVLGESTMSGLEVFVWNEGVTV